MEGQKLYLYPVWLRIWHAINALGIIVLIISGISMQYGNIDYPLISFKTSVLMHNYAGVLISVSYIAFIIGNFVSDNGIHYRFKIGGLYIRFKKQITYYVYGYFKGDPKPYPISKESKFNPLQRVSYALAMYFLMPVLVTTGVALLYPELIFDKIFNYGGVQITAIAHGVMGFFISLFLIIHLYVASIGKHPLKNYQSIIKGYHSEE